MSGTRVEIEVRELFAALSIRTASPRGGGPRDISALRHRLVVESEDQRLTDLMLGRGGTIVTTAAYSVRAPELHRLPYASQKSAVATYTKGIAKAYGRYGVRANCICPGAIETETLHALRGQLAEERGLPYDEALERIMVDGAGNPIPSGANLHGFDANLDPIVGENGQQLDIPYFTGTSSQGIYAQVEYDPSMLGGELGPYNDGA